MKTSAQLAAVPPPPEDDTVSREEQMYVEIYDAIMEHRLPAGTKLAEQPLCDIYQLRRYNVRKVLVKLEADGLVDIEPNRGAYIASPDQREAQDMFELRQMIEQQLMQKLVRQAGAVDIARLRALVAREREAYMQGNRSMWIRLSADFHIELARLGGNALVVDILRKLVSRTTLLISPAENTGHQPCSFDEHLKVVEALEQGDVNAAQREMTHHLEQCACRMLKRPEKRFDLRSALGKAG